MRQNCIYNLVHNRKRKQLAEGEKSLVQIEVIFPGGRRAYLSTGYYFPQRNWSNENRCVVNDPQAAKLNKRLQDIITRLRASEYDCYEKGLPFTVEHLRRATLEQTKQTFTEWIEETIRKRYDISKDSKYTHERAARYFRETAGNIPFNELTLKVITKFDDYLHSKNLEQPSVHKLHQVIRTYINKAIREDLIPFAANPYLKLKIDRGRHAIRRRWDVEEIRKVQQAKIEDKTINDTRMIALFIINTGLSYKDLRSITYKDNYRKTSDGAVIEGLRMKTGEYYTVPLTSEAQTILHHFNSAGNMIPAPERSRFNRDLKTLCIVAGVKVLTSHELRHSAATYMLECGIEIRAVQIALGHAQLRTTQIYGQLTDRYLREQFKKLL
jgi:site-specific recombinase XerD